MCTVSWVLEDEGYQLLCNRDEKLSRAPALGPQVQVRDGVRFIAPVDGDVGGTWIGVNEFGVALAMLNGPPKIGAVPPRTSRGLLALDLLSATCQDETSERLRRRHLSAFAPFTLAVLQPGVQNALVLEWDGDELARSTEPRAPLVSSSFDQTGVESSRRREFARIVGAAGRLDAGVLSAFHQSHSQGPSAHSPCMHRPDAETVSFTRVRVTDSEVTMFYTPAAPCRRVAAERAVLRCRSSF